MALRVGKLGKKPLSSGDVKVPALAASLLPPKDKDAHLDAVLNAGMQVTAMDVQPSTAGSWLAIGGSQMGTAADAPTLAVSTPGPNLVQLWFMPDDGGSGGAAPPVGAAPPQEV